MMLGRIFGALAAAALAPAGSQAPVVPVSLIPEVVVARPGTSFRVAVRIDVPEGWHIGWKHPGQTGLPTTIAWRVPPEISVGATAWTLPERAESAGVVSHVYRGDVLLTTSFTVDAEARPGPARMIAELRWGLCREICIQQEREVGLTIPIVSATQAPEAAPDWASVAELLDERIPVPPHDAGLRAVREGGGIRLFVENGRSAFGGPTSVIYFPEDANRSAVALVSRLRTTEGGLFVPLAVPAGSPISGVLVLDRSWSPGTRARALSLRLP